MSTVTLSRLSATNSSQVHRADCPSGLLSVRSQTESGVRGVGPAERTGKSRVSYWPGGSLPAAPSGCRRPRNPREIGVIVRLRVKDLPLGTRGMLGIYRYRRRVVMLGSLRGLLRKGARGRLHS